MPKKSVDVTPKLYKATLPVKEALAWRLLLKLYVLRSKLLNGNHSTV
jgi:hypothetical protein